MLRDELAASVTGADPSRYAAELGDLVNAIDPALEFELTPGTTATHALVVTPAGRPELRAAAARWLAAAPAADAVWEYRMARIADEKVFGSELGFGDVRLAMSGLRYAFTVHEERGQVDVVCHHPDFERLPDGARAQVTFLSLDWLLGEDQVETWLGAIEWSAAAPADAQPPAQLRDAVHRLAGRGDSWTLMTGQGSGLPCIATANLPLRAARWPRFDQHLAVALPFRTANAGRLPVEGSLDALRAFEDDLTMSVGADGTLVAHETGDLLRTLHLYVDSQSQARARVEAALPRWSEGRAKVAARQDPGMAGVRHLG
ncbi:hypothetical protein Cs7R123_47680 [Catellatospora sp. TT07R-123]|nr:hypothetical protein Cs7R123_47680 [Catellatospora sp. TT07R-123]